MVSPAQNQASLHDAFFRQPDVLVISRHYAPEPIGSAPPIQQMAEWLANNANLTTHVITSRPSYPHGHITPGYETGEFDRRVENGVAVMRWPTMPIDGGGMLRRVVPEARFMMQLIGARLFGRLPKASSVVSLCPSILTVIAALMLRAKGGRHVAVVHDIQSGLGSSLGSKAVRPIMWFLRRVEQWALDRVDHIIVLSAAMGAEIRALGVNTPLTILPPQVDCTAIRPVPRAVGCAPVLMYSGNIGRKQGIEQLIDMAAILLERAPEVSVQIRGDGSRRSYVEARIRDEHLSNVRLLPLVEQSLLPLSLSEADVHLVPQLSEAGDFAVPSKAFAIMAAGRAFITTAIPNSSIGRLAEASGAFLCVPPHSAEALAEAALGLLADPQRAAELGRRGRDFALAHADTHVVMRSVVALLSPVAHDSQIGD